MLSRVADSLYWMSRYFERANHCARVLDATHNLMLNPAKISPEQRWYRALLFLGLPTQPETLDPEQAIAKIATSTENRSSLVSCITAARENAAQVREEISSEMWEQLNKLYHDVAQSTIDPDDDTEPLRLVGAVREGSYKFHGITDGTMNHGEGWHFIQLGKYSERACAVSVLLDAYFSTNTTGTELDWLGLLSSSAAFEAYCKVYTADLKPGAIAEFLLLNSEFPYSVRYSAERMHRALEAITERFSYKAERIDRIIGRLRASLTYAQIDDIMAGDLHAYLNSVIEQCHNLHAALHEAFIEYPIEAAFES